MRDCTPPRRDAWGAFGRSVILPPARVTNPDCIFIGNGVLIREHVMFSVVVPFEDVRPSLVLDDGVEIGRGSAFGIAGHCLVGTGATIGDFVMVVDTVHEPEASDRFRSAASARDVTIGERAYVGSHAVVLPGVTIGAGAFVEHHAVVGRDVPAGGRVAGHPARLQRDDSVR